MLTRLKDINGYLMLHEEIIQYQTEVYYTVKYISYSLDSTLGKKERGENKKQPYVK